MWSKQWWTPGFLVGFTFSNCIIFFLVEEMELSEVKKKNTYLLHSMKVKAQIKECATFFLPQNSLHGGSWYRGRITALHTFPWSQIPYFQM